MMYTPTEKRILAVLSDGMPHTSKQLFECLYDELSSMGTVRVHISNLRGKLATIGESVICELYLGKPHYRHVRLLAS